jgi:hypothetical protein
MNENLKQQIQKLVSEAYYSGAEDGQTEYSVGETNTEYRICDEICDIIEPYLRDVSPSKDGRKI